MCPKAVAILVTAEVRAIQALICDIFATNTPFFIIIHFKINNNNNNNKVSLLKHASTQSKAHKTKTGSGKGQASYIRPNI